MIASDVHNATKVYHPSDMFPAPPPKGQPSNPISRALPYLPEDTPADKDDSPSIVQEIGQPATTTAADSWVDPFTVTTSAPVPTMAAEDDWVDPFSRKRRSPIPVIIYLSHPAAQPTEQPIGTSTTSRPYQGPHVFVSNPLPSLADRDAWPELQADSRPAQQPGLQLTPWNDYWGGSPLTNGTWRYPQHRERRGLLNVVGEGFNWLFGTMSDSDREKINDMMMKMGSQSTLLNRINTEMASKLNVTLRTVQQHDAMIKKLAALSITNFQNIKDQVADFASVMRRTQASIAAIRAEVAMFLTAWEFATTQGALSPAFIEPTRLLEILLAVNQHVKHLGLQLPVILDISTIHVMYGAIKVHPLLKKDTLTLFLHVPLVAKDGTFTLYKSISWPYRFKNSDVYQFFKPEGDYIAVNSKLTTHLLLSEAEVARCRSSEIRVCNPTAALHQGASTCSMALFMSDPEKTKELCPPFYIRQPADRFVGFAHGTSWAFSLGKGARLDITDLQGRPIHHDLAGPGGVLPAFNGVLHLAPNTIARIRGSSLYSGATFQSLEDAKEVVVIPDMPPVIPVAWQKDGEVSAKLVQELKKALNDTRDLDLDFTKLNALMKEADAFSASAWEWLLMSPWSWSGITVLIIIAVIIAVICIWRACARCKAAPRMSNQNMIPMQTFLPYVPQAQTAIQMPNPEPTSPPRLLKTPKF